MLGRGAGNRTPVFGFGGRRRATGPHPCIRCTGGGRRNRTPCNPHDLFSRQSRRPRRITLHASPREVTSCLVGGRSRPVWWGRQDSNLRSTHVHLLYRQTPLPLGHSPTMRWAISSCQRLQRPPRWRRTPFLRTSEARDSPRASLARSFDRRVETQGPDASSWRRT